MFQPGVRELAGASPTARQHISLFLDRLRHVRTALSGDDLQKMGIAPGPQIKEILQRLNDARLDGQVSNKEGESRLVKKWLDIEI